MANNRCIIVSVLTDISYLLHSSIQLHSHLSTSPINCRAKPRQVRDRRVMNQLGKNLFTFHHEHQRSPSHRYDFKGVCSTFLKVDAIRSFWTTRCNLPSDDVTAQKSRRKLTYSSLQPSRYIFQHFSR